MVWNYPAEIALHIVPLSLYLLYNYKCFSTGRVLIMLHVNESWDTFPNCSSCDCFSQVFPPTHSLCECHFAQPNSKLFLLPATAALTAPSSTWKEGAVALQMPQFFLIAICGEIATTDCGWNSTSAEIRAPNPQRCLAWHFLMLPFWNLHLPHCDVLCYQLTLRQGFCSPTLS